MSLSNNGRGAVGLPNFADKTIWTGDNLDILRGLNSESVDLVYLDPPFNSNRNYAAPVGSAAAGAAFRDTWTLSDLDVAWMGLIADIEPSAYQVLQAAGSTHGKGMQSYLCMMAVRLLEMRRVLKSTGSIYLHCDPTASHYLKMLMDAVFGQDSYRNEITWVRTNTHNDSRHSFPNVADVILFYAMQGARFQPSYLPHSPDYVSKFYRFDDSDGRGPYQLDNMASPNPRPNMMYEWKGFPCPPKGWRYQESRIGELHEQGRIYYPANSDGSPDFEKRPRLKRYLNEQKGGVVGNVWSDIQPISAHANERVGYPTQKPLALLERIIKASSNEGDVVLDPFCGCATACVAADRLGRKWIGIDISPKAVELVNLRLQQTMGSLFHAGYVTARTDIPQRTDVDAPRPYRENKHVLFGQQEGLCAGCRVMFPFRNFTIDHVVPKARGGTDHLVNLQLLCGACNSLKGDRPQEYLIARLANTGGER